MVAVVPLGPQWALAACARRRVAVTAKETCGTTTKTMNFSMVNMVEEQVIRELVGKERGCV